jgi:hypothetical protein
MERGHTYDFELVLLHSLYNGFFIVLLMSLSHHYKNYLSKFLLVVAALGQVVSTANYVIGLRDGKTYHDTHEKILSYESAMTFVAMLGAIIAPFIKL